MVVVIVVVVVGYNRNSGTKGLSGNQRSITVSAISTKCTQTKLR